MNENTDAQRKIDAMLARVTRSKTPMLRIEGVDYREVNGRGTLVRMQPKLKGKRARKEERRARHVMREQARRDGRELIIAKWR